MRSHEHYLTVFCVASLLTACGPAPDGDAIRSLQAGLLLEPSYALCAESSLTTGSGVALFAFDDAGKSLNTARVAAVGSASIGEGTQIDGDAHAGGDLTLERRTSVAGAVAVGGQLELARNARIGGPVVHGAPAPSCGGTDVDALIDEVRDANDNLLLGAEYFAGGALAVPNSTTAVIPPGVYYLQDLRVGSNALLAVEQQGIAVFVVDGNVEVGRRAEVEAHDGLQQIHIVARGSFRLRGGSTTVARLVATGSLKMDRGARLRGAAEAARIDLGDQVRIRYNGQ